MFISPVLAHDPRAFLRRDVIPPVPPSLLELLPASFVFVRVKYECDRSTAHPVLVRELVGAHASGGISLAYLAPLCLGELYPAIVGSAGDGYFLAFVGYGYLRKISDTLLSKNDCARLHSLSVPKYGGIPFIAVHITI